MFLHLKGPEVAAMLPLVESVAGVTKLGSACQKTLSNMARDRLISSSRRQAARNSSWLMTPSSFRSIFCRWILTKIKKINRKRKEMSGKSTPMCTTEQVTLSPKRSIISKYETHTSELDSSFRQRYFATLRATKIYWNLIYVPSNLAVFRRKYAIGGCDRSNPAVWIIFGRKMKEDGLHNLTRNKIRKAWRRLNSWISGRPSISIHWRHPGPFDWPDFPLRPGVWAQATQYLNVFYQWDPGQIMRQSKAKLKSVAILWKWMKSSGERYK